MSLIATRRALYASVAGGVSWPSALRDSLVAFWKLDEASGTRADSIGSNTLTDNNTVGSDTGLVYGTAADFELDNSEYLSVASNSTLQTGDIDFWVAAWVRLESITANRGIMAKGVNGGFGDYEWHLVARTTEFRFGVQDGVDDSGSADDTAIGAPQVDTNYFVIAWHDAANNQVGISVNNNTATTAAYSAGSFASVNEVRVGRSLATLYMDGLIGPAMYGKGYVPTADDRSFLYNDGAGVKL